MPIGNILKQIRIKKGLRQNHVAEHVGLTNTSLSSIEGENNREASIPTIKKLCDFYEVPFEVVQMLCSDKSQDEGYEVKREEFVIFCSTYFDI